MTATKHPPPAPPVRLRKGVLYRLRKRNHWRERASAALLSFATWPAGKPGRDDVEREAVKAQDKISTWFDSRRSEVVLTTLRRRAVAAFRKQFES